MEYKVAKGFLYVLTNPAMPGLTKVGKTTRQPDARVAELSSPTGVPSPFSLAFQQPVEECHFAESWVHSELERGGYRLSNNREFFNAPLHVVVKIVSQAAKLRPPAGAELEGVEDIEDQTPEALAEDLYDVAEEYVRGTDTKLPNLSTAVKYFEQSAALGHPGACSAAGSHYRWGGDGLKPDLEKALSIYLKSVALGTWADLALIAGIFLERRQNSIAQKYWKQFFDMARDNYGEIRDRNVRCYGVWYCESVASGELEHCVDDSAIAHLSALLLEGVKKSMGALEDDPERDYATFKHGQLLAARGFVERMKGGASA